jgi:hypothetical protein
MGVTIHGCGTETVLDTLTRRRCLKWSMIKTVRRTPAAHAAIVALIRSMDKGIIKRTMSTTPMIMSLIMVMYREITAPITRIRSTSSI